VPGSRPA